MTKTTMHRYGPLVARIALALLFIISGVGVLLNLEGTASFYSSIGLPVPIVAAILVGIVKVVGGLMVATGLYARVGAWALLIFVALSTLIAHTGEGQLMPALKNLSVMGGFLLIIVYGPGPLSWTLKKNAPAIAPERDTNPVA